MKETIRALIDNIKGTVTEAKLAPARAERMNKLQELFTKRTERRINRAKEGWNSSPLQLERLCYEMDENLDDQATVVVEGGAQTIYHWLDIQPGKKSIIGSTTGYALGWGLGAAMGVKIAKPDTQVVAITGDGAFLFGQIESLWTASRYNIPITIIILNNQSYDGERGRIIMFSPAAKANRENWKDMSCYLGDPEVDYVGLGNSFNIDGIRVSEPGNLKAAFERATAVNREGRPFIIDAVMARRGPGAESTWHPDISIAAARTRKI